MRIPLEFYNQLREAIRASDVVRQRVVLTKKGGEYLGRCPFHEEKTPSFTVNDAKRFYHCFGCGAHGDVIKFVSETNGISYKESAIKLANDNGIDLPKMSAQQEQHYEESDQIYKILDLAAQFFVGNLTSENNKYLKERGLSEETIKKFGIGYAPGGGTLEKFFEQKSIPLKDLLKAGLVGRRDDGRIYETFNKRIMFPIKNIYNKVVGFGGRALGDAMPKYINSPETLVFKKGETMYGENIATGHAYKSNYSIVVEGYMDVIIMHQAGFNQSVASLGTAVTDKHLQKLWRSGDEIIACLDGDNAGMRASAKMTHMALEHITANKSMSFIELPKGLDPDDLIKASGPKAMSQLIDRRIELSEMIWKNESRGKIFKTPEARSALEQRLDEYCDEIKDQKLKTNFRRYFKEIIWNRLIKKSPKNQRQQIGKEILEAQKYSEIEYLEYTICSFMLKYPEIIRDEEVHDALLNLQLTKTNLHDFKEWILETIDSNDSSAENLISDNVKNTGFYDTYLVLSTSDILFLDLQSEKNDVDQNHFFEWLRKKHYLLLLKQEYVGILKDHSDEAQTKATSYLEEIQKMSKELNELSENFINN
ncbi:DNA primase [Rickettsiaceae bacterium]|nr:DNA primase [Rickettsiaceae bacterium]